jgi:EAL domain-containing protein (putative c-di-GMP-specific phosphodiesterase class I)
MQDSEADAREHAISTAPGAVVLVDDSQAVLSVLARALGGGHQIAAFDNAEDAVKRVREGGVDVVVSDIAMPGMSGLDLLRAVRTYDPDLPVIFLTGRPSIESAAQAIEHGVFRYLTKPFEANTLRGTVRHAAQLYRLARLKRQALGFTGAAGASDRTGLAVSFGRALERLSLAFQPVVSVSARSVVGHEAFMRSAEPTLPGPAQIIDAAERLGELFQLGRLVRRWGAELFQGSSPEWLLFLNLHPEELLDPELLEATPLDAIAGRVVLEISERASLEKIQQLRTRVAVLRSRGYRIAVDDLGAGCAGLTSFAVLEPELVKLDISLTRDVHTKPLKQEVIASMTSLCREMGMQIVAEGVETPAERDALAELGCDLQQGYLFARPGPPFPAVTWRASIFAPRPTSDAPDRISELTFVSDGEADRPLDANDPTVLVVDDDEAIRITAERVLARDGISVRTAASGNEALAILAGGQPFNAIVTDLNMPGLHGIEFMRAVREQDLDVPIIVLTGHASLESAVKVVEYGGFRYLEKPLQNQEFRAVVSDATAMHRLATLKRRALELGDAGAWLIGDEAGLDAHFDRALDKLWIAFQPIVAWSEQSVYGYEALVRSSDPMLSAPEQLFEAAERLGRVQQLGRAIRREVAACAASAPLDATIFVNLHPVELGDEELYSRTAPLSSEARRIVFELNERASLHRIADLRERVAQLRTLGFRIAVDDLGAGYAGLSSLSRLEPDVAKVDMSLIRGVDGSTRRAGIVRSMIEVCRKELGARVVCEGVETSAERDALESLGADLLQGFLFAAPEPAFHRPSILVAASP